MAALSQVRVVVHTRREKSNIDLTVSPQFTVLKALIDKPFLEYLIILPPPKLTISRLELRPYSINHRPAERYTRTV